MAPTPPSLEELARTPSLCVRDVERMAKAGVVIKWESIRGQVIRDEDCPSSRPREIEDTFWDRYNMTSLASQYNMRRADFKIAAHPHGDKVSVIVMPFSKSIFNEGAIAYPGEAPFIIEDEAVLYPSDALMAKIALWERSRGQT